MRPLLVSFVALLTLAASVPGVPMGTVPVGAAGPGSCTTVDTGSGFDVSWSLVSGATKYVVERQVDGGTSYWRGVVNDPGTSFTGDAYPTQSYTEVAYTVTAKDGNTVLGTTDCPPETFSCLYHPTAQGFSVTWDPISGPDRYVVRRSVDGSPWYQRGDTNGVSRGFADGPLPNGATEAVYRVLLKSGTTTLDTVDCNPGYMLPPDITAEFSVSASQGEIAPAAAGGAGLCDVPVGSEFVDIDQGWGGSMPNAVKTNRKASLWVSPPPGETYVIDMVMTLSTTDPMYIGHHYAFYGGPFGNQSGYWDKYAGADAEDLRTITKSAAINSPRYLNLTLQNWYGASAGRALAFSTDFTITDQNGDEVTGGIDPCASFDWGNWHDYWGYGIEGAAWFEENGEEVILPFVPGYDCYDAVVHGAAFLNTAGCLADIVAAGWAVDAARAVDLLRGADECCPPAWVVMAATGCVATKSGC